MEGWIKLYRSSLEHWLYIEKRPLTRREAWENMLMLCNHEDDKVLIHGTLIECKRGQSLRSISSWADHFRWTMQKVKTFFNLLENDKMITIEGLQKTTRLTICNYDKYQDNITNKQLTDNQQITNKQLTDNEQITTNKNGKNNKNDKKEKNKRLFSEAFISPYFLPIWKTWINYRKQIRKPYRTENGMIKKYNELIGLCNNDPGTALLIVQQSIDEEWTGLFPLKTNRNAKKTGIIEEDPVDKMIRETTELLKQKQIQEPHGI